MSQLIDNLNTIESIKTDIKAAIENKGVDMTGVSFPGYASKIGEISGGGTVGWDQKSFTEGTIEIINLDNSASFVAVEAFMNDKKIQTVNLPYATSVGKSAFYRCSSLSQVSLPMCSKINKGCFSGCTSLSQVSIPVCSYIGNNAFQSCSSLSQVSLPMCSYIGDNAFQSCSSLSQISLPMCSYIGGNAFRCCTSLRQVSLPVCNYIADGIYAGGGLHTSGTFYQCTLLTQVDLPMCSYIGSDAFRVCSSLSIITIGYSSICSLKNINAFNATQITSSTGSIYVPASLVDAYKSAANWSYFSTQIFPIE